MKCFVEIVGIHVNEIDPLPLHYLHSISYLPEAVVEKVCDVSHIYYGLFVFGVSKPC